MMNRRLLFVAAVSCALPVSAVAQNSVYGVRGAGFPGRAVSVRARGMGGGLAAFDRMSAFNPATIAGLPLLRVTATYGTTFRNYDAGSSSVSGLVESRFPQAMVGGGLGRSAFSFAVGYSTYAERSFDVTTEDTIMVRNTPVGVTDRLSSRGGIVDVRTALGWRTSTRFHLGVALHMVNGSARVSANRAFSDEDLREYNETTDLSFAGVGVSAGAVANFNQQRVIAALVVRQNSDLTQTVDDRTGRDLDMPFMIGGGVSLQMTNRLVWATSGAWRSWGSSAPTTGTFTFDTWEVGSGLEVVSGLGSLPFRLGGRYGKLPFSPVTTQPHEYGVSAGSGWVFAQGRGELDFAVERLMRDGGGASERGWHITLGVSVRP